MANIIDEGRLSRTRKRKMVLPHTPGSLVQGQSRGRGGALWGWWGDTIGKGLVMACMTHNA